jgi:amino acid transporter
VGISHNPPTPAAANQQVSGAQRRQAQDEQMRDRQATPAVGQSAGTDDAALLRDLGYDQELKRGLRAFENVAMGFAAISPVVALYGVVGVGMALAGAAWVWVLPAALAGQCLVLVVYSELASQYPVANASYQWSRRLVGPAYGWFNGWVVLCAYTAADTTIGYLGAPWALTLLGIDPTPRALVVAAFAIVGVCAAVNLLGVDVVKQVVKVGIAAEAVASVGIALLLLFGHRKRDGSALGDTLGAEALSGGSTTAAFIAALAVGGWVFLGFDACGLSAEETKNATRQVPRAVWAAMLSVGAIVILNAVAITLAHPNLEDVVAGNDVDPVTTTVVEALGSWSTRPFAAVTLIAFLACGVAAQGMTARAAFSVARDGVLPASALLRRVGARQVPVGAVAVTTVLSWAGLLLGLKAAAIGTLITFGTAGIYFSFLLLVAGTFAARVSGRWKPGGRVQLGRLGAVAHLLAVCWLVAETVNIVWPRTSIAPPGAPWYQVWAAPLLIGGVTVVGLTYLAVAQPHRRLSQPPPPATQTVPADSASQ